MTIIDEQAHIRSFVKELLTKTMEHGLPQEHLSESQEPLDLRAWISLAAYQKIEQDFQDFYTPQALQGTDIAKEVVRSVSDRQLGCLYLHHHRALLLIRLAGRKEINFYRTGGRNPDQALIAQVTERLASRGLHCETSAMVYVPYDSNNKSHIWSAVPPGGSVPAKQARDFATGVITAVISKQSARDVQRLPGPSDLANPCDLCVARKIASSIGIPMDQLDQKFSLKAWLGTSCHQKVELDLPSIYDYAHQETTARITTIQGLGKIVGHIDIYLPMKRSMVDVKTTDLGKLEKYKTAGVPVSHVGQTMLYMLGLRQEGKVSDYATLAYIPRDSEKVSDIWVASCAYREDIATGLLNRSQKLVEVVRSGDTSSLEIHPDCYVCNVMQRRWN